MLRGVNDAATAICFIAEHGNSPNDISWNSFTQEHVNRLQELVETTDEYWGLDALRCLCNAREDLAALVEQSASQKVGIAKVALLYCVSPTNLAPVFDALKGLTTLSEEERNRESLGLLNRIEIDWSEKADLFVDLLRVRDPELARALLGDICPPKPINLGTLEIGAIEWWLEWMLEVDRASTDNSSFWLLNQLGALFANQLTQEKRDLFVTEFNKADSKYRRILLRCVIPYFKDTTTDAFSEDTISFLLADLNRECAVTSFEGHLLGNTATERFITERILPLLSEAQPPFAENLRAILNQAGSRHGRRYAVE